MNHLVKKNNIMPIEQIESEEQYVTLFNAYKQAEDGINKGISQFQKGEKTIMEASNNIIKIKDKDGNPVAELPLDNNWILEKFQSNLESVSSLKTELNTAFNQFLITKLG